MLARRLGRWFEALESRKQSHGDSRCPGFCLREPLVGLAEPWVDGGRSRSSSVRAAAAPEHGRGLQTPTVGFVSIRASPISSFATRSGFGRDRRPPSALCFARSSSFRPLFVSCLLPIPAPSDPCGDARRRLPPPSASSPASGRPVLLPSSPLHSVGLVAGESKNGSDPPVATERAEPTAGWRARALGASLLNPSGQSVLECGASVPSR